MCRERKAHFWKALIRIGTSRRPLDLERKVTWLFSKGEMKESQYLQNGWVFYAVDDLDQLSLFYRFKKKE